MTDDQCVDLTGLMDCVKDVQIGARAIHDVRKMEPLYVVPDDQILRLSNDPRPPERGSIRVLTEGGV